MASWIFIHFAASCFMTGLIWTVQVLHYPSFAFFPEQEFSSKMSWHQHRISWIVFPVMLAELLTGVAICWKLGFNDDVWNINLAILVLIWLSTMILQGPTHQKLLKGKSAGHLGFLCKTNWIRVALWTLKSLGLLYFLA